MEDIASYRFKTLTNCQVLRLVFKGNQKPYFARKVSQRLLQPYQSTWTPIKNIIIEFIDDIDSYISDPDNYFGFTRKEVDPKTVAKCELFNLRKDE